MDTSDDIEDQVMLRPQHRQQQQYHSVVRWLMAMVVLGIGIMGLGLAGMCLYLIPIFYDSMLHSGHSTFMAVLLTLGLFAMQLLALGILAWYARLLIQSARQGHTTISWKGQTIRLTSNKFGVALLIFPFILPVVGKMGFVMVMVVGGVGLIYVWKHSSSTEELFINYEQITEDRLSNF